MLSGNPAPSNEFLTLDTCGPDPDGVWDAGLHPSSCGNKAARLGRLRRLGLRVLPGVVWGGPLTPSEEAFFTLSSTLPWPWILRSSGLGEDGAVSSFAGCWSSVGPVNSPADARLAFLRIRETTVAAQVIGTLAGAGLEPPAVLIQPYRAFAFTGVALWTRPDDPATLRVEGSSRGHVVDGDAAELLPQGLPEEVARLAERARPLMESGGLDLEWGADPGPDGWEVTLLQARPLLPSAQDPPPYMSQGVWIRNRAHHRRPLSVFYASVVEASRTCAGLSQGAWLGHLYERSDPAPLPVDPRSVTDRPVAEGPLRAERERLRSQTGRFLRFVRSYLTARRPVRPGANCVKAVLEAAPSDCVRTRDRWFRFCEFFPAWWDPQAPSIAGQLERLREICQEKPLADLPETDRGSTPWSVFARRVDSREQDDWVFARMLRVLREACLDWGAAATEVGWLDAPEDAFNLTFPELVSGRPPAARLIRHRIDLQRAQEARLAPERVVDGQPVWTEPQDAQWSGELSGQGAVPGRAEGPAGPLPGADEAADGRIAVVHALTPQDIVFLPGIAGLVVERPGTCGHAVLIARELGIPTVTWAERAVERIAPGARVWIDGATGRVRWHQNY